MFYLSHCQCRQYKQLNIMDYEVSFNAKKRTTTINGVEYGYQALVARKNKTRIEWYVLKIARIYFRVDLDDESDFKESKKKFDSRIIRHRKGFG